MKKNEIIASIKKIKIGYLATCDGQNQPYVRPIDMKTVYDGEIYFSTFYNTDKLNQLKKCSNVEASFVENFNQIRVQGKAELVTDEKTREKYFSDNEGIASMIKDGNFSVLLLYKIVPVKVRYMGSDDESYSIIDWR